MPKDTRIKLSLKSINNDELDIISETLVFFSLLASISMIICIRASRIELVKYTNLLTIRMNDPETHGKNLPSYGN